MTFLERLNIQIPIVQAPMAGVSTPAMAAAVSNAGALGSIGIGSLNSDGARKLIVETQALTNRSFNVNVFCHKPATANPDLEAAWISRLAPVFEGFNGKPPTELREIYKSFLVADDVLELLLELRPAVVSFHFGLPSQEKIERLKQAGITLIATATSLDEGKLTAAAGIDAVVAQGYEAGGHRGVFNERNPDDCLGTMPLTRLLVNNLNIPVIAAGGIMDGAGIAAALSLGASAAQMGTAFIACPESSADQFYRTALHSDAANHTVMTSAISGRPARCLANAFTVFGSSIEPSKIPDYPIAYDAGKVLNEAAKRAGVGDYGAQWAGQGAPLVRELPASDLVALLRRELEEKRPPC